MCGGADLFPLIKSYVAAKILRPISKSVVKIIDRWRRRRHGSEISIVVRTRYETQKRDSPQFDALAPLIIYANDHVAWLYLLITAALRGSHFAARVYVRHKRQLRTSAHVLLITR